MGLPALHCSGCPSDFLPSGAAGSPRRFRSLRTASRTVLGFMNDMAATSRYLAERVGGIDHLDAGDLNAVLRRAPFNRSGYIRPIDAARQC
jgi:hypothetical protein